MNNWLVTVHIIIFWASDGPFFLCWADAGPFHCLEVGPCWPIPIKYTITYKLGIKIPGFRQLEKRYKKKKFFFVHTTKCLKAKKSFVFFLSYTKEMV